jgi:hypothetical protein
MIQKKLVSLHMLRSTKYGFLVLLVAIMLLGSGCSASKKSNCGCPNKKGMVGY